MKNETKSKGSIVPPLQHQFDHEVPTVVHDPEEDMTALAKFVFHVAQEPKRYQGWFIGIAAAIIGIVVISQVLSATRSTGSDVWAKVETAKKVEDRLEIAKQNPKSPATNWVYLQAAAEYYNQAMNDMPLNRDVAVPLFQKALGLYEQVEKAADKTSPEAREAAFGKARTLEARNELPKAIEQYRLVAKNWPDSPEAEKAKQLADVLDTPEAAAYYKDLYAFSPSKVSLPPLGSGRFDMPMPGSGGPTSFDPASILNLPIEPSPIPVREKLSTGSGTVPPKPEPVKAPAPAVEPIKLIAPATPAAPKHMAPASGTPAAPKGAAPASAPAAAPKTVTPAPAAPTEAPKTSTPAAQPAPTPTSKPEAAKGPTAELPGEVFSKKGSH
jgi:hypothetical protein